LPPRVLMLFSGQTDGLSISHLYQLCKTYGFYE
jgi:hypothetical protein